MSLPPTAGGGILLFVATTTRIKSARQPPRGALVMLVFGAAEVLDIAGALDILCAARVRDAADPRRVLLVSARGGLVRNYPSGIALATEALRWLLAWR